MAILKPVNELTSYAEAINRLEDGTRMTKKGLIKKCDVLWIKIIRARDKHCQKCGAKASQAAHIFSRSNHGLRYDLQNGIGMCYYCHLYWAHRSPVEFTLWVQKKWPERWVYLIRERQKLVTSLGIKYYKEIYENLNRNPDF